MGHERAQRLAIRLAREVHHNVLKVLTQGTEQHVQLGGAGVLQRLVGVAVGQHPQAVRGFGERTVDQGAVQAPKMAQRIAKKERAFKAQQRQAVATGNAQIQKQGFLPALLHHQRQVAGQQRAIGVALRAEQHAEAAQFGIRRHRRQALAQPAYKPGHFTGARAISDKIPGPGTHGIEHQLVVHAIAQGHDRQHRLGLQRAFDQRALGHHLLPVQPHKHQPGKGHVNQREQFIEAAGTGPHHLAERRQRALQPLKVGVVARQREKRLAQALAHWDNPLRRLKLPFSRKYKRYQLGS